MSGDKLPADNILNNAEYREKLYSLFYFYKYELQHIIDLATIESNGVRQSNLENEIYSAFSHISRSIFDCNSVSDSCKNIETAEKSHLLRVQYDAYKIALNAILERIDKIVQNYEFLLIDADFRGIMPEAVNIFQDIQEMHKDIRDLYMNAKKYEREGNKKQAASCYESAIEKIPSIRKKLNEVEKDKRFNVALLSLKKKEDKDKEQAKITKKWTYISMLGAAASLIAAVASILVLIFKG